MSKGGVFCPACKEVFDISLLLGQAEPVEVDIGRLPAGVSLEATPGGFLARASCRMWVALLFLIPFTLAWSGFSMAGLYGSQIIEGKFDMQRSLFGLPFLVGTVVLLSLCLLTLAGSTVVQVNNGRGESSIGVGFLRRRRRFDPAEVKDVEYGGEYDHSRAKFRAYIVLHGGRRVRVTLPPGEEKSRAFFNLIRQQLLRGREGSRGMQ